MKFNVKKTIQYWLDSMRKLAKFMEFHIEARYPDQTKDFYSKCTKNFTAIELKEIMEVYKWLKKKL
ncbi:MAG: hypothetical protein A2Y62_02895 [Candidatus Fischerbacteria bacterium RBG_13_37_8]|uniref:HEPN domain-containing protein n=1 Tax=Candidatus Fischerbacteria bacterium RBG_13_37_8 TaxID=1817863 RepID=A0A1F5VYB3_9BACT|nr:MAG: hypothetical protein A2Y62_02895 [Candidatus Fischerbacteria bacterium RBG_13_37_8]